MSRRTHWGTRWNWYDDKQVVSVCTVANVPSAVGWDATQALISEPIRIIDRLIELLGLFAILGGDGPNAESEPVYATAVEKFAFRPQSGKVRLTDSSQ